MEKPTQDPMMNKYFRYFETRGDDGATYFRRIIRSEYQYKIIFWRFIIRTLGFLRRYLPLEKMYLVAVKRYLFWRTWHPIVTTTSGAKYVRVFSIMTIVRLTRSKAISVQISVKNHTSNHHMKVHCMKIPHIQKRCERCEEQFLIPNIRQSRAREKMLMYFPCPYCLFTRAGMGDKSGRCRSCSIPFVMIDHHARGMCMRCYQAWIRDKK